VRCAGFCILTPSFRRMIIPAVASGLTVPFLPVSAEPVSPRPCSQLTSVRASLHVLFPEAV
jgi:hypothetical protein